MKLRDVFYALQSAELQNLSVVDTDTGILKPSAYGRVVSCINMAMSDLHSRFLLKKGTAVIDLIPGQVLYPLKPMHQEGHSGTAQKFIRAGESLNNTILKIVEARDECGRILGINNHDPRRGLSTPSFNVLAVPTDLQEHWKLKTLTITFQKSPAPIRSCDNDYDADCIEVDIEYA